MQADPPTAAEERQEAILARVRAVPAGFVQTYSDIDRASPRLVGRVLATTSAEVPWHRVVRADGTVPLGDRQLDLLRGEGVPLRGRRVDLRHARWPEAAFRAAADEGSGTGRAGPPGPRCRDQQR